MDHRRTPLRRISQGSLSALARSTTNNQQNGPTRLEFLAPAISDLADEMAATHANLENLNRLSDVLETFNESFASFLYAMKMNAFCVEWEQAPSDISFVQAAKAAEEAQAALLAFKPPTPAPIPEPYGYTGVGDETYMTVDENSNVPRSGIGAQTKLANIRPGSTTSNGSKPAGSLKPTLKPKPSVKEKKARDMKIDRVIQTLPIEFRGSDADLRKVMEKVIGALMDNETGKKLLELVKPPELPQAKVNKCLIALVSRKIVSKESHGGVALYTYQGPPS